MASQNPMIDRLSNEIDQLNSKLDKIDEEIKKEIQETKYEIAKLNEDISEIEKKEENERTSAQKARLARLKTKEENCMDRLKRLEARLLVDKEDLKDRVKRLEATRDKLLVPESQTVKYLTLNERLDWASDKIFTFTLTKASATKPKQLTVTLAQETTFGVWLTFNDLFHDFKQKIRDKFGEVKYRNDSDLKKTLNERFFKTSTHDHFVNKLNKLLNVVLAPVISYGRTQTEPFVIRPSNEPTWSDCFYELRELDELQSATYLQIAELTLAILEAKTIKSLPKIIDNLMQEAFGGSQKHLFALVQVLGQVAQTKDSIFENIKVMLLSNHDQSTVFLYFVDEQCLLLSPPVNSNEFIEVVFFVLSLVVDDVADKISGWRKMAKTNINDNKKHAQYPLSKNLLDMIKKSYDQKFSKEPSLPYVSESELTESNDSGVGLSDDLVKASDLLRDLSKCKIVGAGGCGLVCRALIHDENGGEHDLAIKICHLIKSKEYAIEELENEHKVLMKLNEKSIDFVPNLRFYGSVDFKQYMAYDFIDGQVYNEFEDMPDDVIKACIQRVEQLHSLNLMHGDLRAPNFIVKTRNEFDAQTQRTTKYDVVIIDFGRSEFVQNLKFLEYEMYSFKIDLPERFR